MTRPYRLRFDSEIPEQVVVDLFCTAAEKGLTGLVKSYIDRYPDFVDEHATNGDTALMRAAWHQKPDAVEMLLKAGAGVHETSSRGWTPLMMAAWKGDVNIIDILLRAGSRVDTQSNEGLTALMLAANMGREEAVIRLLRENPDISTVDNSGRTAEQMAADRGFPAVVRILERHRLHEEDQEQKRAAAEKSEEVRRMEALRRQTPRSPFKKGGPS